MKSLTDFPVVIKFPIAWGDMDALRHVNNIRFFKYFESARIKFFEEIGLADIMHNSAIGPILASISAKFIKPIVYPDTISTGTRITALYENKFTMDHIIESDKVGTAAVGEAFIVILDYENSQKVPIPSSVRKRILQLQPELKRS